MSPHNSKCDFHDFYFKRTKELKAQGMDFIQAGNLANLENSIRNWPSEWTDDLQILIYGDFTPPAEDLRFEELGIVLHHEKQENTFIRDACCILRATVKITEKNVASFLEATKRINLLLGIMTLVSYGNGKFCWWSFINDDPVGGWTDFRTNDLHTALSSLNRFPPKVRLKIESALYWIRIAKNLSMQSHQRDILKTFANYWNAFEILVEVYCLIRPMQKLSKSEKQNLLNDFIQKKGGVLSPSDIQECYKKIVDPGFTAKASHALKTCFPQNADRYITECFKSTERSDRLYAIRNAINHGDIDALDLNELFRVESKLIRLWMIVWNMFGRLISFSVPEDWPQDHVP